MGELSFVSLLAVIFVFAVGVAKRNPLHLGVLAMGVAFILGKFAGIPDVKIMAFFPTTLFVRVFGIIFFFAIAQANGAIELLAKKMIAKTGKKDKMMPFYLFYTGVVLSTIGINSLAGMAILSGIGISLAAASGANPLLYGIAGGYGIACGCYSPINEYTANIISACETAKIPVNLLNNYFFCVVAFSASFLVIYLFMGGFKGAKNKTSNELSFSLGNGSNLTKLPNFSKNQKVSLIGIFAVILLVVVFKIDVGWAGLLVAIVCILFGACKCTEAMGKVSIGSLMLICGVGTLINLTSKLKGFALMSTWLASVMTETTVAPIMALTSSIMSLFTISRLVVLTLIPSIPGIITAIPSASTALAISATSAGAFASSIGPLSACGALIMTNLGQQYGEKKASEYFTSQMIFGVVGALVVSFICWIASLIGVLK